LFGLFLFSASAKIGFSQILVTSVEAFFTVKRICEHRAQINRADHLLLHKKKSQLYSESSDAIVFSDSQPPRLLGCSSDRGFGSDLVAV
jgi:hypothetical protein